MKRPLKWLFLIALVLSFLIPRGVVSAGDYVSDAIEALKTSSVYVAPGTPGTDYGTPSNLGKFLTPNDNIVLVMLPPEALTSTDLYTLARRISEGLGNQKTVGLAVGREVIGYSAFLPEGVASDKMHRANSVSNDPITALITFTQNIHSWLEQNPQPTPTAIPPTPRPTMAPLVLPKTNDVPILVWVISIGSFFVVIVLVAVGIKNLRDRNKFNSRISKINQGK